MMQASSPVYDFLSANWRKLLLLLCMCLIYFFAYFQRIAVPGICFDELQRDFRTSAAAVTALGSVFLYIYGFGQIFVGIVADRFGGRRTLLFGAGILATASIIFPLSQTLPVLYATRALLAVGAGTIFISLLKEIDTLFSPRHFSILLGIALLIGYSGGIAGTYPFERAMSHFGWRNSLLAVGLLTLLVLVSAAVIFAKVRVPDRASDAVRKLHLGEALRNRMNIAPVLAGALNFGIYFLFQASIGKKMLTDCCGISSARAASITFTMMIFCILFAASSGFISRMLGDRRKPILIAGTGLSLLTTAALVVTACARPDYRLMGVGLVVLGIAASPSPIFLASVKEINRCSAAATSTGIANCAAYVAVAVFTNAAGFVMDFFKDQALPTEHGIVYPLAAYQIILAGCAALAACSFAAAFHIRETRGTYLAVETHSCQSGTAARA